MMKTIVISPFGWLPVLSLGWLVQRLVQKFMTPTSVAVDRFPISSFPEQIGKR